MPRYFSVPPGMHASREAYEEVGGPILAQQAAAEDQAEQDRRELDAMLAELNEKLEHEPPFTLKNNSQTWSDRFLRRMVVWTCEQIGLPLGEVKVAEFAYRRWGAVNGSAFPTEGKIRVVIGPSKWFPMRGEVYPGRTSESYRMPTLADRFEALIATTAHELTHLRDYWQRDSWVNRGPGERNTTYEERRVLGLFRQQRQELIAQWRGAT